MPVPTRLTTPSPGRAPNEIEHRGRAVVACRALEPRDDLARRDDNVGGCRSRLSWHAPCREPMCYTAIMRAGRTRTTSFSLDEATLANLKALAARRHKGNVSALLAEFAQREAKLLAAERLFETYGVPPLDDAAAERLDAEWRGAAPPKKQRRRTA